MRRRGGPRRPRPRVRRGLAGALLGVVIASSSPAFGERIHIVKPGDTLWQIAGEFAGDPHLWPVLYRANRDQIKDPSLLHPGQRLTIPDFESGATAQEASRSAPATLGAE